VLTRSVLRDWRVNQKIDSIPIGEDSLLRDARYASIIISCLAKNSAQGFSATEQGFNKKEGLNGTPRKNCGARKVAFAHIALSDF
jgi:hypothetical protein